MSVADLVNNLRGSVGGLVNTFLGGNKLPGYNTYPQVGVNYDDVAAHRENWFKTPNPSYVFSVIKMDSNAVAGTVKGSSSGFLGEVKEFFGVNLNVDGFTDFALPVSPQEITMIVISNKIYFISQNIL